MVVRALRTHFGRRLPIELGMDRAFLQKRILNFLDAAKVDEVPFWSWLGGSLDVRGGLAYALVST